MGLRKRRASSRRPNATMIAAHPFTPTANRRLNELIGFLAFVFAILLFLALVSYSPLDPSLNTAAVPLAGRPAHNWIGVVGAYTGDLALQVFGITAFLLPVFLAMYALSWFRSRPIGAPYAKTAGAIALIAFLAGFIGLLPRTVYWKSAIPSEGLTGRIVADALIHYFNVVGAYVICVSAIAVGLYLSTAFSFGAMQMWSKTRLGFFYAAMDRFADWRIERARKRAARELEKKRAAAARPVVTAQLIPERATVAEDVPPPATTAPPVPLPHSAGKTGIERMFEAEEKNAPVPPQPADDDETIAVSARADATTHGKTTMPRLVGSFKLPSTTLLHRPDEHSAINELELKNLAQVLTEKCGEFDVRGQVVQINPGPVVTTFEFKPEAGIKYSRITSLCDDLCLALRAESILIERMAGKSTVGIQVPNRERETIWLRELVESQEYLSSKSKLTLALGKDINGRIVVADLASMPHLLIAGSTGSGKSVAINAMIMSMLYKATPEEVRLILVDPKRLELGVYEGVPHLYTPIITEPKLAANALRNAVREMERRLKLLAEKGVRNIDQYNQLFEEEMPTLFENSGEEQERPLPYLVIIIDELADLMMLDSGNVEESITRLAQMARAVGIHLILATQRPSVDVITGLIKANFPARISFRVATKVDSRTILDANGAESLLGRGDMLYLPSGSARLNRMHGPFVTEDEITAVCDHWRSQAKAVYNERLLDPPKEENAEGAEGEASGEDINDDLYQEAVRVVCEAGRASTSTLQRRLRIGYGRAARLIDIMEKDGIVGPPDGTKPREVLKAKDWMREIDQSLR